MQQLYRIKDMHPIYLSFLLQLLLSFASSQNTPPPPYAPTHLILLSCGASADQIDPGGRKWVNDSASEYVPRDMVNNDAISSPSVSQMPYYSNARIFRSNFTYSFPVSAGPMFLRLYFYPKTYIYHGAGGGDIIDTSTHFFSVTANGYTLLSNFSSSLGLAPGHVSISKEFIVSSGDGELKVTFIPYNNSYAFVNAIEVVSMPPNLYSNPNNASLETVHRVTVGSDVLPRDDTGMFRAWRQDQYLVTNFTLNMISQWPSNLSIDYIDKNTPEYMAPEVVYRYSRVMGGDAADVNFSYNLTWNFPVDPGFSYLFRLHFCETQMELITGPRQRMFNIYIGDQMVEEGLDVFMSAGGTGVPIHRDYVIFVSSGTGLGLALHPYTEAVFKPEFNDVILNGAEVFKMISGPDRSLAGLNPDQRPSTFTPASPPDQRPSTFTPASPPDRPPRQSHVPRASISGGIVGFLVLSVLCFLIFWRRVRHRNSGYKQGTTSLPSDLCRHFSIAEIKAATNNFDQVFVIGAGGFGNVYKGTITIDGGPTHVAIKRLNPGSKQGLHEFLTEIEMLSRLRHLNLVSLIGFCEDDNEMILVYDYMSRGTLRDHLYNTHNPSLNWTQRLQICIGAARGLQYLHTGANHPIIHRDVKTTNILIDEKYVAKVSDFGLSRIGATSVSKTHVTTVVKGSFGYLDPEYFKRQHLTEKSDVYSFGVVLCEVICAKPALNRTVDKRQVMNLAERARDCYRKGTFESLIDAKLKGEIAAESLNKYMEIAMKCLGDVGSERPSMGDVVWVLEFVLGLQKAADKGAKGEEEVEVESDDSWEESSTESTTVVGSSISGERVSMDISGVSLSARSFNFK